MKKNTKTLILCCAIFSSSYATVRNVPATYATVQAALTACLTGDTVLVQTGIYTGNIIWPAIANIKLLSNGDSSDTKLSANNIGRVMSFSSALIDSNTIVRGFTISNGFLNTSSCQGAGVYISNCSPKFEGVSISYNHSYTLNWNYGAGVYASNSSVIFRNSDISNNTSDTAGWGYGGGVHLKNGGSPKFYDCKIMNNEVHAANWNYGSGIYCSGVNLFLENVSINGNSGGYSTGYNYGMGLYVEDSSATLLNVSINNNSAGDDGNYNYGMGANFNDCNVSLTNVQVVGNSSGNDGGYYYGGGLSFSDCNPSLINVLVASNTMGNAGNFYRGAGIFFGSSAVHTGSIMHTTVTNNEKADGGAVLGSGILYEPNITLDVRNSIFWNPNSSVEISGSGATAITYSDVRNGFVGTGNINIDPAFISANDFHLTVTSPCTNAGTLTGAPTYDLDNNPRPLPALTNPDMGCFEASTLASITTTLTAPIIFCQGANVSIPFTTSGTFLSGNIFTAQLSNALGSFASPTNIGTLNGTSSGSVASTIPLASPGGTAYRIRVVGSNPSTTGSDNGTDLTIHANPMASISASDTILCVGENTTLSGSGGLSFVWLPGSLTGPTQNLSPLISTTYTLTTTNAESCSGSSSLQIIVNPLPSVSLASFDPDTLCKINAPIMLSGGLPSGGVYSGTGVSAGMFDPALVSIGTHTITYSYTDGNGCSSYALRTLTVDECVGINKNHLNTNWYAYVENKKIFVKTNFLTSTTRNLSVINALGQIVFDLKLISASINSIEINCHTFSSGVYFIKIESESEIYCKKIILP